MPNEPEKSVSQQPCPSVTCPEFPPSHPGYSCFPCPTVHPVTCPPGFCPPTHPNVTCRPCINEARITAVSCMPCFTINNATCGNTCSCPSFHVSCQPCPSVPCPSIEACPPPTHVQCTSQNPACTFGPFQQMPQQQAGGGVQYYRGARTGTYNPYGSG